MYFPAAAKVAESRHPTTTSPHAPLRIIGFYVRHFIIPFGISPLGAPISSRCRFGAVPVLTRCTPRQNTYTAGFLLHFLRTERRPTAVPSRREKYSRKASQKIDDLLSRNTRKRVAHHAHAAHGGTHRISRCSWFLADMVIDTILWRHHRLLAKWAYGSSTYRRDYRRIFSIFWWNYALTRSRAFAGAAWWPAPPPALGIIATIPVPRSKMPTAYRRALEIYHLVISVENWFWYTLRWWWYAYDTSRRLARKSIAFITTMSLYVAPRLDRLIYSRTHIIHR